MFDSGLTVYLAHGGTRVTYLTASTKFVCRPEPPILQIHATEIICDALDLELIGETVK